MLTNKLITGVLIGAGAGLIIGLLMTDKGKEVREKIKNSGGGLLDLLCDYIDKGKESLKNLKEDVSEQAEEVIDHTAHTFDKFRSEPAS